MAAVRERGRSVRAACCDGLVVVMTRNKIGKNQGKYNGPFWDAIRDGVEKPVPAKAP